MPRTGRSGSAEQATGVGVVVMAVAGLQVGHGRGPCQLIWCTLRMLISNQQCMCSLQMWRPTPFWLCPANQPAASPRQHASGREKPHSWTLPLAL